ncbi:UNVERIFIED_ORG: hypothetical protein J2X79_003957 [Arthrobacter globiformis]|nr:hypothetical protein [Arthrobacter globiformis]
MRQGIPVPAVQLPGESGQAAGLRAGLFWPLPLKRLQLSGARPQRVLLGAVPLQWVEPPTVVLHWAIRTAQPQATCQAEGVELPDPAVQS